MFRKKLEFISNHVCYQGYVSHHYGVQYETIFVGYGIYEHEHFLLDQTSLEREPAFHKKRYRSNFLFVYIDGSLPQNTVVPGSWIFCEKI